MTTQGTHPTSGDRFVLYFLMHRLGMDRVGVSAHVEQVGAPVWMHFQYSAALEYVSLFCVSLLQDDDLQDDAGSQGGDSDAVSPTKKVKRGRALQ